MNILLLSWRGPKHPNAGGAEISTHEHAKGWVRAGHKVTLFTSYFKGAKKEEVVDGVQIIRKGSYAFGVHLQAVKWYLVSRKEQFDIVVDQFHGIPFFTPLYVRGKKLAFIHEVTKEVWKLNPWSKPFDLIPAVLGPIIEPLFFKIIYKNIPFMTVSNSTRDDLISWGIPRNNITVVHNGITTPKIKNLPFKERIKTLSFLGAISKDKGIEDALRIFSLIKKKDKDWQFWIVGKAELRYKRYLNKLIKDLGLKGWLKFWGYVSERRKFDLLARAHILVNPSIREGWGLVVTEGATVGTPTVGYNVPGLKDSVQNGKTGILTDPNTKNCADAILSLIDDKIRYGKISKDCIKWSKNFSWDKSARKSLHLIKKLVEL